MSPAPDLSDYEFELPQTAIAQRPADRRADSRLLVWRADGAYEHRRFSDLLVLLEPGDLLVLNDTRVFPARLHGRKRETGAGVEVLLVRPRAEGVWEALVRPSRRLREGSRVDLEDGTGLSVGEPISEGTRAVRFDPGADVLALCARHGHVPLPPYIRREDEAADRERYQTVFARFDGSVAAPTAGLHFDQPLLDAIDARGVERATVTLHVGPGTFRPPDKSALARGILHAEWRDVPARTLDAIARCRARSGRIVAVGTTVCRALESLPPDGGPADGDTTLMIAPGHAFRFADVLVTNFHLPCSSLLMLVDAFAGPRWRDAYALAIAAGYRFYSYGDANWIERAA